MSRKKITDAMAPRRVPMLGRPTSSGSIIAPLPNELAQSFSKRFAAAALGGASVIAIASALVAGQTSDAMAQAPCASNNVTGNCLGPINPTDGTFWNSGSIGGSPTGVNIIHTVTDITSFSNTGLISASATTLGAAAIRNAGAIGNLINSGTISAFDQPGGISAADIVNNGSIDNISNIGLVTVSASNAGITAIANSGVITRMTNSGTIRAAVNVGNAYGIYNGASGTITRMTNDGIISVSATAGNANGIINFGVIDSLTNNGTISVSGTLDSLASSGDVIGFGNIGTITSLTNNGVLDASGAHYASVSSGGVFGLGNTGTITNLTNNGTISASSASGGAIGIYNSGVITNLTNNGTIRALMSGIGIINELSGAIDHFTNNGLILASAQSSPVTGLFNNGMIGNVTNNGAINASGTSRAAGIRNFGAIAILANHGMISAVVQSGSSSPFAVGISNQGSINTLTNIGTISASATSGTIGVSDPNLFARGIDTTGFISDLTNTGVIEASVTSGYASGLSNSGAIIRLTNMGVIHAAGSLGSSYDIVNSGSIGTFINAQGGSGIAGSGQTEALTYKGQLPDAYLDYITSSSHYGQLNVTNGSGVMTFDIAPGSQLHAGTYESVIVFTDGGGTIGGALSGKFGSHLVDWMLQSDGTIGEGGTIYDLVVPVNNATTQLQLEASRRITLDAMRMRAAVTTNALAYDCDMFDKSNVCISFNARYTSMDEMNEGAGVFTAAYRINQTMRIGAFIDYAGKPSGISGVEYRDSIPLFGAFMAYSEKSDGTGLQAKLTGAYEIDRATLTRNADLYDATEAGSGSANISAFAIGSQLGYGFAIMNTMVATPYVGLQYGDATRASYQEAASDSVTAPITYDRYNQNILTGTMQLHLDGQLDHNMSYRLTGGVEYDLTSEISAYSGSIFGLSSFSIPNTVNANRLRGNGSLALSYAIAPKQKLTTSVSVRGEAYSGRDDTNVMAGYEVGF